MKTVAPVTALQQRCKFCGCSEFDPCVLHISADGVFERAQVIEHMRDCEPCAWVVPDICSAPDCVRRGYEESCRAIDAALATRPETERVLA